MNSKGFTLLETIVVVLIVGILSMLAVFGYSSTRQYSRTTAREQMIQAIRNARMEAIARNTFVGLQLNSDSNNIFSLNTYTSNGGNYTLDESISSTVVIGDSKNTVVTFSNLRNFAGGTGFLFNSRGILVNANSTPVRAYIHFGSNSDTKQLSIEIEPTTGYVYGL